MECFKKLAYEWLMHFLHMMSAAGSVMHMHAAALLDLAGMYSRTQAVCQPAWRSREM
jgi:hypothetical protein